MNSESAFSRRQALLALLATITLPLLSRHCIAAVSIAGKSYDILDVTQRLTSVLSDGTSAREIGKEYLNAYPDQNSISFLVSRLMSNTRIADSCMTERDDHEYRKIIRDTIMNDFETENIVSLNGWMLSRTEVQLCALATYV